MTNTTTTLGVKSIDHITIVVSDLERSARFYDEVLGMRRVARPEFGFPGAWLQAGTTQIHMNVAGSEAGPAGLPPCAGTRASRGFHFAFEVEDFDAAHERLLTMGIEIVDGPRHRPDGARQMYLYDPDGHLIELMTPPPA